MKKVLFLDRDGTLIYELQDTYQVNGLGQIFLIPGVISSLKKLSAAGWRLVMVTNQDALGSEMNPRDNFEAVNQKLLDILASEDIVFDEVFVCPHSPEEQCACRKPRTGMLTKYLAETNFDLKNSYVIGDRETDLQLAKNIGIQGLLVENTIDSITDPERSWVSITKRITEQPRRAQLQRTTKETDITLTLNLDGTGTAKIKTGLPFFDHMLEQVAKHGSLDLELKATGDLEVDAHHTIEDVALALGEALAKALGDKRGMARFGQELITPMDESRSFLTLDLSGRPYCVFEGSFDRAEIQGFPTEIVKHFFESFSAAASCTLHAKVEGENTHHQIEALFKGLGRALKMAVQKTGDALPSTKGIL